MKSIKEIANYLLNEGYLIESEEGVGKAVGKFGSDENNKWMINVLDKIYDKVKELGFQKAYTKKEYEQEDIGLDRPLLFKREGQKDNYLLFTILLDGNTVYCDVGQFTYEIPKFGPASISKTPKKEHKSLNSFGSSGPKFEEVGEVVKTQVQKYSIK